MVDRRNVGRAALGGLAHCIGAGLLAGLAASLVLGTLVLALNTTPDFKGSGPLIPSNFKESDP